MEGCSDLQSSKEHKEITTGENLLCRLTGTHENATKSTTALNIRKTCKKENREFAHMYK